jgi:hypothetical protein
MLLFAQLLDYGDAEYNAKDAVEGAGVGDGVEVGADEKAWAVSGETGPDASQIARGVDVRRHACGFHPTFQKCVYVVHWRREKETRYLSWGLGATGELAAAGDYAVGSIFICACHHYLFRPSGHSADARFDVAVGLVGGNEDFVWIVLTEA